MVQSGAFTGSTVGRGPLTQGMKKGYFRAAHHFWRGENRRFPPGAVEGEVHETDGLTAIGRNLPARPMRATVLGGADTQ